jgi:hypothetical protein
MEQARRKGAGADADKIMPQTGSLRLAASLTFGDGGR